MQVTKRDTRVGIRNRRLYLEKVTRWICKTCGTQFGESATPPQACAICEDERQYVGWDGQQWTTLDDLRARHRNAIKEEEPGLWSIHTDPGFGIGQRAFLVRTGEGNILWDCVAVLDEETARFVREAGGVRVIAISHPHYYTTMVEWSRAFGGAPIHLHEAERRWVMSPDAKVEFWSGERKPLFGGASLARTGGHFEGFQVLHWPAGAAGRGALLAGDQPQVCMDRRWVTFLYSYPNMIPLGARAVRDILARQEPLVFDRLYGAFPGKTIWSGAKEAVQRSAERYLRFLEA